MKGLGFVLVGHIWLSGIVQQTIVQIGRYYAGDEGEPLEKVLSCALKADDDFISLFK